MVVCNQGWYQTTYGYDGADQLVSETNTGGNYTPSLAYTYDHNGNRLTQTSNGQPYQSFTYDAHDKLTSGTAGNETDTYDANGSETRVSIYGGVYQLTWDDEDRLVGETLPSGQVDTFVYNGLGLRVGKTDSTGTYSYVCDGASPGSPVLSDGHALYTPGLSESRGGVSTYAASDVLGNLWFMDNGSGQQTYYQDTTGFGTVTAQAGSGSPFGYGGGNGCQTDADTGVVLMGHRYYDTRIGRFISQDPAGAGGNWYAYAGNSPVNHVDPLGLWINSPVPETGDPDNDKLITDAVNAGAQPGEEYDLRQGSTHGPIIKTFTIPAGNVFNFGGAHILFPPGVSIDRNIKAAKNFMASNASKSVYHYGWHGSQTGQKYDVNKIAAWLISNVDTGMGQDYKTGGMVYDASGHVNYAAVATELGFDTDSIIAGQQFVHFQAHGYGSGLEPTGNEFLGQRYDQQFYNPGAAIFDVGDSLSAFINYKTGL